eukprot:g18792.t1
MSSPPPVLGFVVYDKQDALELRKFWHCTLLLGLLSVLYETWLNSYISAALRGFFLGLTAALLGVLLNYLDHEIRGPRKIAPIIFTIPLYALTIDAGPTILPRLLLFAFGEREDRAVDAGDFVAPVVAESEHETRLTLAEERVTSSGVGGKSCRIPVEDAGATVFGTTNTVSSAVNPGASTPPRLGVGGSSPSPVGGAPGGRLDKTQPLDGEEAVSARQERAKARLAYRKRRDPRLVLFPREPSGRILKERMNPREAAAGLVFHSSTLLEIGIPASETTKPEIVADSFFAFKIPLYPICGENLVGKCPFTGGRIAASVWRDCWRIWMYLSVFYGLWTAFQALHWLPLLTAGAGANDREDAIRKAHEQHVVGGFLFFLAAFHTSFVLCAHFCIGKLGSLLLRVAENASLFQAELLALRVTPNYHTSLLYGPTSNANAGAVPARTEGYNNRGGAGGGGLLLGGDNPSAVEMHKMRSHETSASRDEQVVGIPVPPEANRQIADQHQIVGMPISSGTGPAVAPGAPSTGATGGGARTAAAPQPLAPIGNGPG